MMQVTDFKFYIESGLGRGLTLLRREPDKTPYRQTVLDYYTKSEHFMRSIGGAYDAELIRCFPDADALSAEIAVHALDRLKTGKGNSMISLLVGLGHKDTATAIVEQMYRESYAEVLKFTQNGGVSEEKLPAFAVRYSAAVQALGHLCVSRERMKQALLDMADLYLFHPEPVIPTVQTPLVLAGFEYGRDAFCQLLEEVEKEHPHGKNIVERSRYGNFSEEPKYAVTAQQIFDAYREDWGFDIDMHIAFAHATEDVIRAVAEEILREEDEDRRIYLMGFFCDSVPHICQPAFPLDPSPLVSHALTLHPVSSENRQEYGIVSAYYSFLGKVRHPDVKALGQKILAEEGVDHFIRESAVQMVFGANFEAEDASAFMEYAKTRLGAGISVACRALDMGIDLPYEVIECVFVYAGNSRLSLVKKLLEKGKLHDALRVECRLDSNMYIRKLVAE